MFQKNVFKVSTLFILTLLIFCISILPVKAADELKAKIKAQTSIVAKDAGYAIQTGDSQTELYNTIAVVLNFALGFLSMIFLVLIIWSGIQWMTAGGNSDAIGEAKGRIINATIGLAIVLAAYGLVYFVMKQLVGATGGVVTP